VNEEALVHWGEEGGLLRQITNINNRLYLLDARTMRI
jgi:hypothetical protein